MAKQLPHVAVVGVGLIGGSVAAGCKARGLAARVTGVDSNPTAREIARARGLVDAVEAAPGDSLRDADLVVLSVPVGALARVLGTTARLLRDGTTVTDVGSVKRPVVTAAERALPAGPRFVGGHPIAGTEGAGPAHASPRLFEDAMCILTPTARTDPGALAQTRALWEGLGARVVLMDAERHDAVLAATSHLPHVLAYALVGMLAEMEEENGPLFSYGGGGLRDMTRIAQSPATLWREICLLNRDPLLKVLGRFREGLARLEALVVAGNAKALEEAFQRAGIRRREVIRRSPC